MAVRGNALKEAKEWDRTRNIMFAVIKAASGKKGPKKVADVMQIPLLDKPQGDRAELKRKLRLAERHNEYKKKIASDGNAGT